MALCAVRSVRYALCGTLCVVILFALGCVVAPVDPSDNGGNGGGDEILVINPADSDTNNELIIFSDSGTEEFPTEYIGNENMALDSFNGTITIDQPTSGGANSTANYLQLVPTATEVWAAGGWAVRKSGDSFSTPAAYIDMHQYQALRFYYKAPASNTLGLEMKIEGVNSETNPQCHNETIAVTNDDTWREVTVGLKHYVQPDFYGGQAGDLAGQTCNTAVDLTQITGLLIFVLIDDSDNNAGPTDGQIDLDEIFFIKGDDTEPSDASAAAGVAGDDAVTLAWTAATDADVDGYRIQWSAGATAPPLYCNITDGNITFVSGGATVTDTISGLDDSTAYSFRICAEDFAGNPAAGVTAVDITTN